MKFFVILLLTFFSLQLTLQSYSSLSFKSTLSTEQESDLGTQDSLAKKVTEDLNLYFSQHLEVISPQAFTIPAKFLKYFIFYSYQFSQDILQPPKF
ncbi:MAG: hypothetical protein ACOYL6_12815 [Bacteriovoracaceae bacterium]